MEVSTQRIDEAIFPPFYSLALTDLPDALKWFEKMSEPDQWDLSKHEKLHLLGGIPEKLYFELLANKIDSVALRSTTNVLERLGLLLGIAKSLDALIGKENVWKAFSRKNSSTLLQGNSIKEFLLQSNSIDDFYKVKKYLLDNLNR